MKKISLAAIVIFWGCVFTFGQRELSALSLVPAKSVAVVRVDWTKARGDKHLRQAVRGDEFSEIIGQTGTNEANVKEFVIFLDFNPTSSGKIGLIVSGSLSLSGIVKTLESKGWKAEKFGSRTGYVNPLDGSYLLPLNKRTFVAGTKAAVEQTSDRPESA